MNRGARLAGLLSPDGVGCRLAVYDLREGVVPDRLCGES
jgi:hypothetical protein